MIHIQNKSFERDMYSHNSATTTDCWLKNRKVTFSHETGDSGADEANRTVNQLLALMIPSDQHIVN